MAKASKQPLSGRDILHFLRSFEGAAATFGSNEERWTLWLPEMTAGDHPLTPASQVFFPVILRHGQHAIAIRFLYDCSTGKMRYYTSAIPGEIASRPEFENAVSELFRHSLPVEPMRERKLGRDVVAKTRRPEPILPPRPAQRPSLAEPEMQAASAVLVPAKLPSPPVLELSVPAPMPMPVAPIPEALEISMPVPERITPVHETRRSLRVEIGPRVRSVLVCLILSTALVALVLMGIYAYLEATQDPGVLHHRMELEQMRLQQGR